MKIEAIRPLSNNSIQNIYHAERDKQADGTNSLVIPYTYPLVYFTGKKIVDIDEGKNKLIRQLDEILKEDAPQEEINTTEIQYKGIRLMMSLKKQLDALYSESEILWGNKILNPQQKYNRAMQIKKEVNSIKKIYDRGYFYIVRDNDYCSDEKTDYVLVNKFKSCVLDDNFSLKKVLLDYYSPISEIHSLKELKEKYPKIHIPQKPEDVIARKLESTITRDFYEKLDEAFVKKDKKKAQELLSSKIMQLLNDNIKIKSPEQKESALKKLIKPTTKAVSTRYYKLHNTRSFSSVPEFRKVNKNLISENDIKLLNVNYEDYVLTVLKEQYTNFKNPNDIIYNKNGKTIKVSSIKEAEYKFDKFPNRIIKLVQDSARVKDSQRDYKNYNQEHFKKKLTFYAEKFGESERLLDTIVQFDSCMYGEEDIQMLIKFLKEADKVWDGEKTIKDLEEFVCDNSIRPVHTEKMNAIERKKKIEEIKAENKKIAELKNIQDNFDAKINILYENNLNYIAGICSKYKPNSLDPAQIKISEIINDILEKNISGDKLKNKEKAETQLMRIMTYLDYSLSDSENAILKNANLYAHNQNNEIDMEKAGKYILNAEFVQNYPQSLELASNKEIAKKIMQNSSQNKAIEYLCKYDDYKGFSPNEKSKISNIIKIFDINDSIEKSIIKTIIEEDYLKSDTSSIATLTENGSKKTRTTIGKNAKNQIYDYYKFPKCLDYFELFENAMTRFAANKNSAGIKKVISTDANELKIKGFPDRLFAYNNSYYFDEFSPTGLH